MDSSGGEDFGISTGRKYEHQGRHNKLFFAVRVISILVLP
jgi:hypothetical protein